MSYAFATSEEEKRIEETKKGSNDTLNITEITEKLNSYYNQENYSEYLNYLNRLPINDLPENFLEYGLDKLNALLVINFEKKFKFQFGEHLKGFFIPFALLFMSISNFFHNYNRVLLTIINGYCIVDFSIRTINAITSYFKEKKEFNARASDINHHIMVLIETINEALNNSRHLENDSQNEESKNSSISKMVAEIGSQSLDDKITHIRSLIATLPIKEEKDYLERLEKAIKAYNVSEDLDSKSTISLQLNNQPYYLYAINKELDNIEKEIKERKNLFVTNEEFKNILAISVTNYLASLATSSDLIQSLINIQNILVGLESDNSMRNIAVSNAYAECFWETIKMCNNEDDVSTIIEIMFEKFMDAVILRGEYELDSIEQTLEVISERTYLLNLKGEITDNDGEFTPKMYLEYMISVIKRFIKPKNINRIRELNN